MSQVFSRYEKHRQLILEEIFTSLARLPTSKRSLRNFRYRWEFCWQHLDVRSVCVLTCCVCAQVEQLWCRGRAGVYSDGQCSGPAVDSVCGPPAVRDVLWRGSQEGNSHLFNHRHTTDTIGPRSWYICKYMSKFTTSIIPSMYHSHANYVSRNWWFGCRD